MIQGNGVADVYTDFNGLAKLRGQAKKDPKAAAAETARQFESMFVQMALKSMRQASEVIKSELGEGRDAKFFREMYDQQLAVELGKRSKLGVGEMVTRQISGSAQRIGSGVGKTLSDYRGTAVFRPYSPHPKPTGTPRAPLNAAHATAHGAPAAGQHRKHFDSHSEFAETMWPHAQAAAAEIGVDPKILLAQAALETNWGKSLPKHADGSGYNLFGIKADRSWKGDRVSAGTTEFEGGGAIHIKAAFRAYNNYGESFQDYVQFLKRNRRYATALANAGDPHQFVASLQRAGYATDPSYARKILSIYEKSDAFDGLPGA